MGDEASEMRMVEKNGRKCTYPIPILHPSPIPALLPLVLELPSLVQIHPMVYYSFKPVQNIIFMKENDRTCIHFAATIVKHGWQWFLLNPGNSTMQTFVLNDNHHLKIFFYICYDLQVICSALKIWNLTAIPYSSPTVKSAREYPA